jgi:hypothetical protein
LAIPAFWSFSLSCHSRYPVIPAFWSFLLSGHFRFQVVPAFPYFPVVPVTENERNYKRGSNKLRYQLRLPATVIGGIELMSGNGYCKEKVSQTVNSGCARVSPFIQACLCQDGIEHDGQDCPLQPASNPQPAIQHKSAK